MANVDFYKGQSANLSSATKSADAFYYTEDKHDLFSSDGTNFYRIGGIPIITVAPSTDDTSSYEVSCPGLHIENGTSILLYNASATYRCKGTLSLTGDNQTATGTISYRFKTGNVSQPEGLTNYNPSSGIYPGDMKLLVWHGAVLRWVFVSAEDSIRILEQGSTMQHINTGFEVRKGSVPSDYNNREVRNIYLLAADESIPNTARNGDIAFYYE